METYTKTKIAIEGILQGLGYHNALRAMRHAESLHIGFRRDKKTPEFEHQVAQMGLALTLRHSLLYPEETLCTIAWHDSAEDKGMTRDQMRYILRTGWEGTDRVVMGVDLMSKEIEGVKKDPVAYLKGMETNPIASFAKVVDRWHNLKSMNNPRPDGQPVFKFEKQAAYFKEATDILAMQKVAMGNFPEQYEAQMAIRLILKTQMEFGRALLKAVGQEFDF